MKLVWPATMPMKVAAPMPNDSQDHGEEAGFVDMLLGAKADGKGAAGGDQCPQPGGRARYRGRDRWPWEERR